MIIGKYLQRPAQEGCIRVGREKIIEHTGGPRSTARNLTEIVRLSEWVFSAEVTAHVPGFNGSDPGTLLEVVPQETIKGPQDRGGAYYVFMPVGTFSVDGKKICKTDDNYTALPEVGDRVFLFLDLNWLNQQGRFLWTGNETGIITVDKKREVHLPKRYLASDSRLASGAEEELVRFVRTAMEEED